jgi:hypothetical protein
VGSEECELANEEREMRRIVKGEITKIAKSAEKITREERIGDTSFAKVQVSFADMMGELKGNRWWGSEHQGQTYICSFKCNFEIHVKKEEVAA